MTGLAARTLLLGHSRQEKGGKDGAGWRKRCTECDKFKASLVSLNCAGDTWMAGVKHLASLADLCCTQKKPVRD